MKPIIGIYGIQDRQSSPFPLETHDHALCRIESGRVVRHLALERYTRRKHDNQLHVHISELAQLGFVTRGEDVVLACADSFVGRSFISKDGDWRVEAPPATTLAPEATAARAWVMGREVEAWVVPHELAHMSASLPFLGAWENDTLLVHVDGAASLSCCSAWLWRDGALHLLHHGWDLEDAVAGYATNNLAQAIVGHDWRTFLAVPGKLMGLAAWGTPATATRAWLERHAWFASLRGGPAPFIEAARAELGWDGVLAPSDPLIQTVAACFQARIEDAIASYVERFALRTGARHLVLAGGGALNLPSNQRISDAGWFDDVFVPPCAGDDGLALGAAAFLTFSRYGPLHRHSAFLNNVGAPGLGTTHHDQSILVADTLAAGKVVGTCLGAGEVGPRALGHRSLLAVPTREVAHRVSVLMKGREPWRPVAPLVLAELADDLFDGAPSRSPLARYMLGRFGAERASAVAPGVVHADGTARVQVVDDHPEHRPIRDVLEALWERHRIPCLVNTSFNQRGEPLVQTVEQARAAAGAMQVDLLFHGGGAEEVSPEPTTVGFDSVSADLVAWRADTIRAAVETGLLDGLPTRDEALSDPERRVLAALGEIGHVDRDGATWRCTSRGALLRRDHPQSLAGAARYWASAGRAPWRSLPDALRDPSWQPTDPFAAQAADGARVHEYHAVMSAYARHDYARFPDALDPGHSVLIDAGGGFGELAQRVLRAAPDMTAVVLDRSEVVDRAPLPADIDGRLRFVAQDLFLPWRESADAIVLARVLHDWPDDRAVELLTHARNALAPSGRIYIVEMVRPRDGFAGALLDLHMMLSTGGRERTESMFRKLLSCAGLRLVAVRPMPAVSSVLVAEVV